MAEGYLRHFSDENAEVSSAGIEAHGVNQAAIATMKEDGIDITMQTSNRLDEYRDIQFDFVITVCDNAKERCPYFPTTARMFHQNFSDPAKASGSIEEIKAQFTVVRNQIKEFCRKFVEENLIPFGYR